MTQMNLSVKQKHTHRHRECICSFKGVREERTGSWDLQMPLLVGWISNKVLCEAQGTVAGRGTPSRAQNWALV